MSTTTQRYRLFLLIVSGVVFAGTLVELWFTEHLGDVMQLIPFVLSGLGLCAVGAVLVSPRRSTLFTLRAAMGVVALGGIFGIYQHFRHNLAFELEIRPNAAAGAVLGEALRGASPMLAPGILTLAAVLAVAATYEHPVLRRRLENSRCDS